MGGISLSVFPVTNSPTHFGSMCFSMACEKKPHCLKRRASENLRRHVLSQGFPVHITHIHIQCSGLVQLQRHLVLWKAALCEGQRSLGNEDLWLWHSAILWEGWTVGSCYIGTRGERDKKCVFPGARGYYRDRDYRIFRPAFQTYQRGVSNTEQCQWESSLKFHWKATDMFQ